MPKDVAFTPWSRRRMWLSHLDHTLITKKDVAFTPWSQRRLERRPHVQGMLLKCLAHNAKAWTQTPHTRHAAWMPHSQCIGANTGGAFRVHSLHHWQCIACIDHICIDHICIDHKCIDNICIDHMHKSHALITMHRSHMHWSHCISCITHNALMQTQILHHSRMTHNA